MLAIVRNTLGDQKIGVIQTEQCIVPLCYSAIAIQKYGIIAYKADGYCDVYGLDGTTILQNTINPVLLDGNFLIVSDIYKKCYIFKYGNNQTRPFNREGFDAIAFFMGSKLDPVVYSYGTNYQGFFNTPDYINYGASFDKYICAARSNCWGIINRNTGKIEHDFTAKAIIHRKNAELVVNEADNLVKIYK